MNQLTIEQPATDIVSFSDALTKEQVAFMKSGNFYGVAVHRKDTMTQVHCDFKNTSLNRYNAVGPTVELSFNVPGVVDAELIIEEAEGEYFQRVDDLRSLALADSSNTLPPLIVTYCWSEDVKV